MAKDPAFLLYSKDFYEGTRLMLPEERACYLDLLIFQHQNGPIPEDTRRILMYCSGINEATLIATLEAKFKLGPKGWLNEKLQSVIENRNEFTSKQSINGKVGQFWKKCKAFLSPAEYQELRVSLGSASNEEIFDFIKDKQIAKATLKAMLKALLKHLVNVNAIVNVNVNTIKNENENETQKEKSEPAKSESLEAVKPKAAKIDYEKIVDIFNSVCHNLPTVQKITPKRKAALKSLTNEYGLNEIGLVFQATANSKFLNGENDRGWAADFDWLTSPNNFIKILEGKYNDKPKQTTSSSTGGPSSDFRAKTAQRLGIIQP